MRKVFLVGLALLLTGVLAAQQTMNNESVIKLIQAGLSEELIISTINASPGDYDISVDGLLALKEADVGEKVLAAMLAKETAGVTAPVSNAVASPAATPVATTAAAAPDTSTGLPPGVDTVGVYYKGQNGAWKEINVEVVNFSTGGFLKNVGTMGVVKRDLNGTVRGNQSKLAIRLPAEFLFYLPEGTAPGEYQLLHLRANRNNREFRSVTGGVFNTSSGAGRDQVDYTAMKVAPRVYTIMLDRNVNTGEYGFLPPSNDADSGVASRGRMFTFTLVP